MVTHSKFPAAGMSRPLDTSLRLKTFSSKSEYQLVVNAVRKLQESGFYWSAVTGGEANLLLSAEPAGTFLIRDSSDQRHFFTLSVKTQSGTKNLRIQCEGAAFRCRVTPEARSQFPASTVYSSWCTTTCRLQGPPPFLCHPRNPRPKFRSSHLPRHSPGVPPRELTTSILGARRFRWY